MDITFARQTLSTIHVQYTVQDYNAIFHWNRLLYTENIPQQNTWRILDSKDLLDEMNSFWLSWFTCRQEELIALLLHTSYLQTWPTNLEKNTTVSNYAQIFFLVRNCLFRNAYQMIEKINYLWVRELSDLPINKENWVRCTASKLITWIWLAGIWQNSMSHR